MAKFNIQISGISPLIQSNVASMEIGKATSEAEINKLLEAQVYRQKDGYLYHPAEGVRKSFLEAAKFYATKINKISAKTFFNGIITIIPYDYVLLTRNGKPLSGGLDEAYRRLDMSAVNNNCKPPARIMTHRPIIDPWESSFVFEIDNDMVPKMDDSIINAIKETLKIAGKRIGIGVFSPRKTGMYGRYEITKFEKVEEAK